MIKHVLNYNSFSRTAKIFISIQRNRVKQIKHVLNYNSFSRTAKIFISIQRNRVKQKRKWKTFSTVPGVDE